MKFDQKTMWAMAGALAIAASATNARAGEGSGYNGPVTAGASIPVALDRAVTLDTLTRTYGVCLARMAKDIVQQFTKLTPEEFGREYVQLDTSAKPEWAFQRDEYHYARFEQYIQSTCHPKKDPSGSQRINFAFTQTSGFTIEKNHKYGATHYPMLSTQDQTGTTTTTQFREFRLPFTTFNSVLNEATYDELGNLDESTLILDRIELHTPSDYQDQIPLINRSSGRPSALKVNLKAYVDCFYNEIQK
jgi:hypothetical protein